MVRPVISCKHVLYVCKSKVCVRNFDFNNNLDCHFHSSLQTLVFKRTLGLQVQGRNYIIVLGYL